MDYGQAVKFYEAEPIGPGRYSPKVVRAERTAIAGSPDTAHLLQDLNEAIISDDDEYFLGTLVLIEPHKVTPSIRR